MNPRTMAAPTRSLRISLDALLVVLLIFTTVIALNRGGAHPWAPISCAALFGLLYLAGRRRIALAPDVDAPRGQWWPTGVWIGSLTVMWAALLGLIDVALWIAFPLMFLQMHFLGPRRGPIAVVVTAGLASIGALNSGLSPIGSVLGPALGAAVAIGVVLGLEAIVRESQERLAVIDELTRTRADLAAAEGERATTAERERLAREIHDTLAQGFSSIGLLLRAADQCLTAEEPGDGTGDPEQPVASDTGVRRARELLSTAQDAVHENLVEARRVVRALAPPALDAANLVGAVERLAARTSNPNLRVSVQVTGEARELSAPVETALLRIAQSAVANVVQHAEASRALLTITFHDQVVTLDVVDDGRGFAPEQVAGSSTGGFGITAIRSRVAELGGTLVIESEPGGALQDDGRIGSALVVQIPSPPEQEA